MTADDRVAITGIGVVSALGVGAPTFTEALLAGRSGIRPLADVDPAPFVARHAGQATSFEPGPGLAGLDRHLQMAVAAATEALAGSGLDPSRARVALVFSTCTGPLPTRESAPPDAAPNDPEADPARRIHGGAILLARRLGITGPVTTIATACAASAGAIGRAADLVRSGAVDAVLAGGADAFSVSVLAGFDRLRTTSSQPCAPFSLPAGLTLGEGAGFWVVEPESAARARRAPLHGFVLGHGLSNDAHHPTAPDPTGAGIRRSIAAALADAGIRAADLGHVSAHGSGTQANDRTECRAIARAFEDAPPPISSTKAALGHALGAAGILEATASLVAIGRGMLPPTLHFTTARAGCDLDCVPNVPRPTGCTRFLSQNLAFHGHNAAVILATPDDPPTAAPRPAPCDVVLVSIGIATDPPHAPSAPPDAVPHPADRPGSRGLDREADLAHQATRCALAAAHVPDRAADRALVGLVLGQCAGTSNAELRFLERWRAAGPAAPDLAAFPFAVPNAAAGHVARLLGLKGWSTALCAGHGAGLDALACAADAVRLGHVRCVAAGAADAHRRGGNTPSAALATADASAEAAAILVLEDARAAAGRAAPVLARVASWDAAFLPMGPGADPAAPMAALLARALGRAGLAPHAVGACCLSSDPPGGPLDAAAARLLPEPVVRGAFRAQAPFARAHGTAPLLALAAMLDGGPARVPVVVASLSRHGEARVVVLVPPDPAPREAPNA